MPKTRRKGVWQITDEEMKEYAEYFKSVRLSLGLTRPQMAEEIGVFRTTICRWERAQHIPQRDIHEIVEQYRAVVKKYKKLF